MEHNNLTSIASARPIIYAEGLFASCYLDHGKFIPEEGLSQADLWSILSGEFLKSGSDLIEDFALKDKLLKLENTARNIYELDEFPKDAVCGSCNVLNAPVASQGRQIHEVDGIPLLPLSTGNKKLFQCTSEHIEVRECFEKQVSWIMSEDGEEFVSMETFQTFTEALILLDVLKQHNVPSVVSFLSRRDEPIAITFSKIQIGLDSLMFCLFQA